MKGSPLSHAAPLAFVVVLSGCDAAAGAIGRVVALVLVLTIASVQIGALLIQLVRFVASQPRSEQDVRRDPSAPSLVAILLILLSAGVHWFGMVPLVWSHPASNLSEIIPLCVAASLAHAFVVALGLPAPKPDLATGRPRRSLRTVVALVMTIVALAPVVVRLVAR